MRSLSRSFTFFTACLLFPLTVQAQRDLKDIPIPDPELERQTFVLPEGFEVNLFAADPQIAKPIQMNFDPQGRLWIASSETYPHIEPGAVANDKIIYLQDLDGDGVSDVTQVFADGLLIPTAVLPGDGGVYVGASTELLHFRDTTQDGRADQKRIIFSGFGTEDTHHILHTLRYGPESLLYFSQSIYIHSHIETPWGIRRLNAGGIWRFRPETLELDVFARGLVNSWGTAFDRYGQTFATDGAGGEGINYKVPGASYVTAYGAERILRGLNPGSPKHCGLEIVESEHLPDDWQGSLITNDFRGHRVCRFVLTEDGSGFRSQEQQEVIKSNHVAFRPIDVKQGPDGAIYIADWYNPIIQHGEVDFRDPRRDHTHGRIWRVTYTGKPTLKPVDFTKLSTADLLKAVERPNQDARTQAKVVLKERGVKILSSLDNWIAATQDNPQLQLEGLWIYQSLGRVQPELLERCLTATDHRVRAAAVRVTGQLAPQLSDPLMLLARSIQDEHPRVRLETIRALAEIPEARSIEIALEALQQDIDQYLDYTLWLTCRDLEAVWTPALLAGELNVSSSPRALPFLLRATRSAAGTALLLDQLQAGEFSGPARSDALSVIADIGTTEHLATLYSMATAPETTAEQQPELLQALHAAAVNRNAIPEYTPDSLQALTNSPSEGVRRQAVALIGAWKVGSLRDIPAAQLRQSERSLGEQQNAVRAIGAFADDAAAQTLQQVVTSDAVLSLQRIALEELLKFRSGIAARLTVQFLQRATVQEAQPLFVVIQQRKGAPEALAAALAEQTIPKDVAVVGARVLGASGQQDSELARLLRTAGQISQEPVRLSESEMLALMQQVQQQGNPVAGEAIFRRENLNCVKCHAVGPAGGQVGSNLVSLGATAQLDYIIESVLDPNAKIKEGYHTVVVATEEGKIFSGIQIRETDTQLYLRDAEGREVTIEKESILDRKQGNSLMPAGLMAEVTQQELLDLVAFLYALGRTPEFTIGTQPVVRLWETLVSTPEAAHQFRRLSYAAATTENSAFHWRRAYSHVDGRLELADLPELAIRNRVAAGERGMSFVRSTFTTGNGKIVLHLNDVTGLQIWLGEQPVEPSTRLELDVPAGEQQLTFAIDRSTRTTPLLLKPDLAASSTSVELATGQ